MKRLPLALGMLVFLSLAFAAPAGAQTCQVDVFDLDVLGTGQSATISGYIKNRGNVSEHVEWTLFADGEEIADGSASLDHNQQIHITNSYFFPSGETEIILEATANCGAFDREEIVHTLLAEYTCFPPPGTQGQNYCDYGTQRYLSCQYNGWVTLAQNSGSYCTACGAQVCGDGVCNCWEQASSCPRDCSVRQPPGQPPGQPSGGSCVEIAEFAYTDQLAEGSTGTAWIRAANKGAGAITAAARLTLDGIPKGAQSVTLQPFGEADAVLSYSPAVGVHWATLEVSAACGSDQETVQIVVADVRDPISFQEPVLPREPIETLATIGPDQMDIPAYAARAIGIDIRSRVPQRFRIQATGVPAEWISLQDISVDTEAHTFVYLTPRAPGTYTVQVTVTALDEGTTFSRNVQIFVPGTIAAAPTALALTDLFLILGATLLVVAVVLFAVEGSRRRRTDYFRRFIRRHW